MKIGKETVHVSVNGEVIETRYLNRGYPRALVYVENKDIATELSQGKPAQKAQADAAGRKAEALFGELRKTLNELSALDSVQGASLAWYFMTELPMLLTTEKANKKELAALCAAAFRFAGDDECGTLDNTESIFNDDSDLIKLICADIDSSPLSPVLPGHYKTTEALRIFKEIRGDSNTEEHKALNSEGKRVYDMFQSLDKSFDTLTREEIDRRTDEAFAAFDALAIKDPEEATRVYKRSSYFDDEMGKYDVCLGVSTYCNRFRLRKLNTPELREAYLEALYAEHDAPPVPIRGTSDKMIVCDGEITIYRGYPISAP